MTTATTSENRSPRYAGGEALSTARRYTLPKNVLRDIRKCCPVYGSQARVLQVATEILIRQKKPIKLTFKLGANVGCSIKLLPRTIQLIDRLTPVYGSHGEVFAACVEVLREPV